MYVPNINWWAKTSCFVACWSTIGTQYSSNSVWHRFDKSLVGFWHYLKSDDYSHKLQVSDLWAQREVFHRVQIRQILVVKTSTRVHSHAPQTISLATQTVKLLFLGKFTMLLSSSCNVMLPCWKMLLPSGKTLSMTGYRWSEIIFTLVYAPALYCAINRTYPDLQSGQVSNLHNLWWGMNNQLLLTYSWFHCPSIIFHISQEPTGFTHSQILGHNNFEEFKVNKGNNCNGNGQTCSSGFTEGTKVRSD